MPKPVEGRFGGKRKFVAFWVGKANSVVPPADCLEFPPPLRDLSP